MGYPEGETPGKSLCSQMPGDRVSMRIEITVMGVGMRKAREDCGKDQEGADAGV